ncbi:WecB/TagA/CpsF family glycosyltransferase [Mesorhizobium sp. SP-1A]|uniref:WecB/TagA/CpsF family glycosyltransferase n=1 Tax=Mesorhizobium sp. SP-1A TaxID=3077840 RepID=UPI0028F6F0AA|nr:WecB/TagA/CpsF family glycosyltransferase [Mesorhizobium sp. SP-1A]
MASARHLLFGFHLDAVTMEEVVERCRVAILTRDTLLLSVVNAAKIVKARADPVLRNSLMEGNLMLADGQSVVWASRFLGRPLPERVAGIDVFQRLLQLAHDEQRSIYLLGARPDVLEALRRRLETRYPGLRVAGARAGYFADGEAETVAAAIRACRPDMLFLGMTSPKKEIFLGRFGPSLGVPVLHGVGGSFDILAGVTQRAPVLWQKAGMEWAYRVLQEPRRLWWRYLSTNTAFLALTLREMVRPTRAYSPPIGGPGMAGR